MTMRKLIPVFTLLLVFMSALVQGGEPLEALRVPVDQVIAILKDPQYEDRTRKGLQREKIWEIIPNIFDYTEVAKRSLARNWKIFTPQERKEFTDVFADFLGNTYIDKIEGHYEDLDIVYLGQEMVTDSRALVKTRIVRKNGETPIDYRMRRRGGAWRIYDLHIEGVSLVKNYRTQFNEILFKETPAQLIERLQEKVETQKTSRNKPNVP